MRSRQGDGQEILRISRKNRRPAVLIAALPSAAGCPLARKTMGVLRCLNYTGTLLDPRGKMLRRSPAATSTLRETIEKGLMKKLAVIDEHVEIPKNASVEVGQITQGE